jgi:plasmid maintenance system antidote protein VapI
LVENKNFKVENATMSKHVGKIILDRLRAINQTQTWLAEYVGVSNNAVSKWIDSGKISRANAIKVAEALNISTDDLLAVAADTKRDQKAKPLALMYIDEDEIRLITQYRESNAMGRALIDAAARSAPRAPQSTLLTGSNHER